MMNPSCHEIERKFFINTPLDNVLASYPPAELIGIEQRYLLDCGKWTTRIRRTFSFRGTHHYLTFKRKISDVSCTEIENEISVEFYNQIALQCGPALCKVRHRIIHEGHCWEIDKFLNPELLGLYIAEIELKSEDEVFSRPWWLGEEVTQDRQYKNAKLVRRLTEERE